MILSPYLSPSRIEIYTKTKLTLEEIQKKISLKNNISENSPAYYELKRNSFCQQCVDSSIFLILSMCFRHFLQRNESVMLIEGILVLYSVLDEVNISLSFLYNSLSFLYNNLSISVFL